MSRTHFEQQLDDLTARLVAMSRMVEGQMLIEKDSDWTLPIELSEAATIAQQMLRDVLDAFVQHDPGKAREVTARDDRVDQLDESHLWSAITLMMESPARIGTGLSFILISRNIERIADLATNIGEDVVYQVEGRLIRHPDAKQ